MRIVLTADPEIEVPPRLYGGIERIIDMLARGLSRRGHEVTLFAHPASQTSARLIPWPGKCSSSRLDTVRNAVKLSRVVLTERFDVVHSFSRMGYLTPILPLKIPKLMTYQRKINRRSIEIGNRLSRGSLHFSAISEWMTEHVRDLNTWHLIFNGVSLDAYEFSADPGPEAPLVFLGRIEEIKGPHLAIEVAKKASIPLVIAGNVAPEHQAWFDENIAPHVDGKKVIYRGPVDDIQKNVLLRSARALLMPILWDEPFGIVMIEAMACGTPVVGFPRGAVPEVVQDGINGFVVAGIPEMITAVKQVHTLDRRASRARVEKLYSEDAIVEAYIDVYNSMRRPVEVERD